MIILPKLPYDKNELEPFISAETLSFHYDKHHQSYAKNLNNLTKDNELHNADLENIIQESHNKNTPIFNNAAQVWNHSFYWNSMQKNGGQQPEGEIKTLINNAFGNYENFYKKFHEAGVKQFGSGWVWLVINSDKKLSIMPTSNADLPMVYKNIKPIITMDVWEHSYYLDYQNRRPDYITIFLDKLINWQFAEKNLENL